jgi:hypothetical protein
MGYFSNGTEGDCYYEQYCSRCLHNGDEDGPYCPVWALHKEYNYAECNKEDSFLNALIPREGHGNGRCKMFVLAPSMGLDL